MVGRAFYFFFNFLFDRGWESFSVIEMSQSAGQGV